jgi:hypothetical protein
MVLKKKEIAKIVEEEIYALIIKKKDFVQIVMGLLCVSTKK